MVDINRWYCNPVTDHSSFLACYFYQITSGQRYNDYILHKLCFTGPLMIMASSFVEFWTVFTTKVLFRKRKEYKSCKLSLNMKTHWIYTSRQCNLGRTQLQVLSLIRLEEFLQAQNCSRLTFRPRCPTGTSPPESPVRREADTELGRRHSESFLVLQFLRI